MPAEALERDVGSGGGGGTLKLIPPPPNLLNSIRAGTQGEGGE